jgi:hypothetical protein
MTYPQNAFGRRAFLLACVAGLAACSPDKPQFRAIDITGAEYARDFNLTDHNGQPRSIKDFAGKVVVVFFGFTQCPDVCPTALAELAEVKRMLGKDGDKLQGIFVTVDPERDTPEVLKGYMANFDPSFLALRGTPSSWPPWPRTSRSITRRWTARRPPATPWTIRRAALCMTHRAASACTRATAAVHRRWRTISGCCSSLERRAIASLSAAGPSQGAKAPSGGSDPHEVGERGGLFIAP